MEWDNALADLLLGEPEIRSWLGLDPQARDVSELQQADADRALEGVPRPAVAA
jgi:hypothetical protein